MSSSTSSRQLSVGKLSIDSKGKGKSGHVKENCDTVFQYRLCRIHTEGTKLVTAAAWTAALSNTTWIPTTSTAEIPFPEWGKMPFENHVPSRSGKLAIGQRHWLTRHEMRPMLYLPKLLLKPLWKPSTSRSSLSHRNWRRGLTRPISTPPPPPAAALPALTSTGSGFSLHGFQYRMPARWPLPWALSWMAAMSLAMEVGGCRWPSTERCAVVLDDDVCGKAESGVDCGEAGVRMVQGVRWDELVSVDEGWNGFCFELVINLLDVLRVTKNSGCPADWPSVLYLALRLLIDGLTFLLVVGDLFLEFILLVCKPLWNLGVAEGKLARVVGDIQDGKWMLHFDLAWDGKTTFSWSRHWTASVVATRIETDKYWKIIDRKLLTSK